MLLHINCFVARMSTSEVSVHHDFYFEVRECRLTGSVFRCCSSVQAAGEEESPGCDAAG